MYAARLPITAPLTNDLICSETLNRHLVINGSAALERRKVSQRGLRTYFKCLPSTLRSFCIGVSSTVITADLPPHIHKEDVCAINFYVHADGAQTVFYTGDVVKLHGREEDSGNGYFLVDPMYLTPATAFKAATGDVWVLDTQIPHAV